MSIPNTPEYLHYVLILCGYKKGLTWLWNQMGANEKRPIFDELLNLEPVLRVCQFEKEYFQVDCRDDVLEELRECWCFMDFHKLPERFRPFLFLAFDNSRETFTIVKLKENIDRFKIGPRKYPT